MGHVAVELANIAREVLGTRNPRRLLGFANKMTRWTMYIGNCSIVLMDDRRGSTVSLPQSTSGAAGHFHERFADHAVEVGRRVVFQVTGSLPRSKMWGCVDRA